MKYIKDKNGYSSSSMKTVRTLCTIIIMAVLSCALSIVILSVAGVIHFGPKEYNTFDIVYNDDNDISDNTDEAPKKIPDSSQTDTHIKEDDIDVSSGDDADEHQPSHTSKGIIVLDPGHGISSSSMSDTQKQYDGWLYNPQKGGWGEWRHYKSGSKTDCMGSNCLGRAPKNGSCWYAIGNGDRDTEPDLNMNNVLAAQKYLEEMGYTVRVTRSAAENPSMTKRTEYCYPNNDTSLSPDADVFVCVHSNAGGGSGSYYIALSGQYDQPEIPTDYIEKSNTLGKFINDRIVSETALSAASGGRYDGYPELILFFKSPVPIAYMEIGFYDNASDLAILKSSCDAIGKAIAEGVNDYMTTR